MNIVPIDMQMCIRIALPVGGNVLPEPRPLQKYGVSIRIEGVDDIMALGRQVSSAFRPTLAGPRATSRGAAGRPTTLRAFGARPSGLSIRRSITTLFW